MSKSVENTQKAKDGLVGDEKAEDLNHEEPLLDGTKMAETSPAAKEKRPSQPYIPVRRPSKVTPSADKVRTSFSDAALDNAYQVCYDVADFRNLRLEDPPKEKKSKGKKKGKKNK